MLGSRTPAVVTPAWQRICVAGFTVPAPTTSQCFVQLNGALATFHLDDASLEFVQPGASMSAPVPPPPPPPAPPPAPPPPPAPLVPRALGFLPSIKAVETESSFESGSDGFSVFVDGSAASVVNVSWASEAAARTGTRGLMVGYAFSVLHVEHGRGEAQLP